MPHVDTPISLCHCGVARCDITPPVGIYHRMWGAATHDRSTGVHRPLTATALVLAAAPEARSLAPGKVHELVLIALDHCILWPREMTGLLDRVSAAADVPREQVLVCFSHTHAAGLMGLERADLPGGDLIAGYLQELALRLADIVREAKASAIPATVSYGTGRCSLAANRDFWDAERSQWVCGLNPQGPADDTLIVARLADFQGQTLAVLVNYACHPTTLAWDNTLISPDYPGAMREVIEREMSAPCLFVQGASGDLGPRDGYVGDVSVADKNGLQLGYAALSALAALPPPCTRHEYAGPVISGAVIGTWRHVPLTHDELRAKGLWRYRRWSVDLPYRPGLPSASDLKSERARRLEAEQAARAVGDDQRARDCRAQAEIATRQMVRLGTLPSGPTYSFPIQMWQTGDAIWIALEAEHYHVLQRRLRERFPQATLVIATLVNGSLATYLPPRETYGTGVYQETIALLAPGCLEQLIDEIAAQAEQWLASTSRAAEYNRQQRDHPRCRGHGLF